MTNRIWWSSYEKDLCIMTYLHSILWKEKENQIYKETSVGKSCICVYVHTCLYRQGIHIHLPRKVYTNMYEFQIVIISELHGTTKLLCFLLIHFSLFLSLSLLLHGQVLDLYFKRAMRRFLHKMVIKSFIVMPLIL